MICAPKPDDVKAHAAIDKNLSIIRLEGSLTGAASRRANSGRGQPISADCSFFTPTFAIASQDFISEPCVSMPRQASSTT